MRILVTSDWQADYENLDLCKATVEEILRLKDELGFNVLVHAGDLKHVYNPVDVRVVNFWMRTITQWKKAGLEVFINLGNHDRVGMHVDKQNWLPVLRKAGAQCFDDPTNLDGLAFLPFRQQTELLKKEAADLAAVQDGTSILIFHCDLKNARYNVLSRSESAEMSTDDLYSDKYVACIGGHLHFQHKVAENVWYVGSPFATDWGEANQKKGYLLVDTKKQLVKRIPSKAPGWYDPSWPGFAEARPESWKGAKIRIKVPCNGVHHVREILEKAETEASRKYVGADIVVIPEFRDEVGKTGKIKGSYPDEKKIRVYVQESLPDELRKYESSIKKYLVEQLSLVGGLQREYGELKFDRVVAENFLSFEQLDVTFAPGLCVVAGENCDWKGRSNGAGKSSYLQPIAVAHSGQTFKGQKHDQWMRRGTKKKDLSLVKLWLHDAQGRPCKIVRSRQPVDVKLVVSKEIVESGNRPENTQKLIEQVTGYTWETLANAIYIDQAKSHLMLTGTEKERKGFLAKLQNLERFERAAKVVKTQKDDFDRRYELNSAALTSVVREEKALLDTMHSAKRILALNANIAVSFKRLKKLFTARKAELMAWYENAEKEVAKIDRQLGELTKIGKQMAKEKATVEERKRVLEARAERFEKLEGVCPTCEQEIDEKLVEVAIPTIKEAISGLEKQLEGYDELEEKQDKQYSKIAAQKVNWLRNDDLGKEVQDLRVELEGKRYEWKQYLKQKELLESIHKKVVACQEKGGKLTQKKNKISKWLAVLKYAMTVFQRNGLPAYLNSQICPELNQAAKEYSELFAQSEIQVRFAVDEEGRLDVQVINAHGGENVEDQSEGEMKMASLITSFAVRSAAPKTNILILDEPGDGLDAVSARSFARGLREVVNRFGTVLLTTHNPAILSELADARLVMIRKQGGVSEVVDGGGRHT